MSFLYVEVWILSVQLFVLFHLLSKEGYGCKWTWDTIQHYTETQFKAKEHNCYCCFTFHRYSKVFANEHKSYFKWVRNCPFPAVGRYSLCLLINATFGNFYHFDVFWWIAYFVDHSCIALHCQLVVLCSHCGSLSFKSHLWLCFQYLVC